MNRFAKRLSTVIVAAGAMVLAGSYASADNDGGGERSFRAKLDGGHEVPAISTTASGEFRARLDSTGTELSYELTYEGLEGGNTLFAHVHIGQTNVNGGVMFFLCGGGGKPACPNVGGTVTGIVRPADVQGPAGQGITVGQFEEAIKAMRKGLAYANVHTATYGGGEIRGQLNDSSSEK
jgi:hypothetical protein